MKYFNPLRFFYFHLLLLQLQEYDLVLFIKAVINTKGIPPKRPFRKPLKFTAKIILISALTLLLMSLPLVIINKLFFLPILILQFYFSYIFLIIIYFLILPIDFIAKKLIIFLAKNKIKKFNKLKIIGITGSYGKTGMKDLIATVLAEKYRVLKTPESINTQVGISRLILKELNESIEIFIVEMGEYYSDDIKKISLITPPQISVITGINEAHLEIMKTMKNIINNIFAVTQNMRPNGTVLLNANDKLIKNNYKKYITNQEIYFYQAKDKFAFNEDAPGYIYQKIFFPILGQFNLDKIDGVIYLAKKLGLTQREIENGLKKIKTPNHRLQPIFNLEKNILVIDDSYNGNPDGVGEAIKTLSLFKKRRKIFVTPGLVEIGDKSKKVHQRIGKRLSDVVNLVILIKNSATPDIEEGLIKTGFDKNNIIWFDSMMEAQNSLNMIIKSGDVVLFQNDWPDNYV